MLALLPIASGAGIFLLVSSQRRGAGIFYLLPVGVFGVLITAGLFLYELRGIQRCNGLIGAAERIEKKLMPELGSLGAFNVRPEAIWRGLIGSTGAALTIYPTVIGAWVYVAGVGWSTCFERNSWITIAALAASALPVGAYIIRATGEDFKKSQRVTIIR